MDRREAFDAAGPTLVDADRLTGRYDTERRTTGDIEVHKIEGS